MGQQLERLVESLKSKLKSLKAKKLHYSKVEKTESMRAQKLIAKNLAMANSLNGHKYYIF
ncbi:hypothetical protein ACMD2_00880 [Ananas comosus]|uniref:Uncharacterized protein n=1 Tax=Ananas comosus TaxID=4615 RepID=A0A199ULR2_ANACO|nr:hypothetical protein ACMD2_00880 [Ananas comosus]